MKPSFVSIISHRAEGGGATPLPPPSLWAPSLGFMPDPTQAQILDSPAHRLILLCTRQFGKTTLTALKALHFALTNPGSLTVVASPCERRSGEWIRLLRHFSSHSLSPGFSPSLSPGFSLGPSLSRGFSPGLSSDRIHRFSAVLPNGSRLIGLPGTVDTNRGYPAHLLIFEEAAFIPDGMFHVLTGSLAATHGSLWLISTAGPQSGFFHQQWHQQDVPWTRFKVPATQCPRIQPEFLAWQRLLVGDSVFRREFLCEFQPGESQLITRSLLARAADDSYSPLNHGQPLFDSEGALR